MFILRMYTFTNCIFSWFAFVFSSFRWLQMFIPCTYMCTNCNFGIFLVAFLSKWRPQKSIPCTYTCTKCSLGAFLVAFLIKMASPKQHSVHVYVYIMHFLGIFGCVFWSKKSFGAYIVAFWISWHTFVPPRHFEYMHKENNCGASRRNKQKTIWSQWCVSTILEEKWTQ